MKFFVKTAISAKTNTPYTGLYVTDGFITKPVSFDIEVLLLVTGLTLRDLRGLPVGEIEI